MRITALLLILLSTVSSTPSFAASDPYSAMKKQLSALILKDMARDKVKGLSIAVVADQQVVWAKGFGYADEAAKIPATPDTVYRMGSISKILTAMHVMQLADAGRVDIDADVRRYVPEFSIRSRFADTPAITPRMLMTHRSGLPSDVVAGMWSEHPMSLAQYIPTLSRESMASPPVTQFRYSNIAFSLLGRMIEEVEGADFNQAMRQGLLDPLGMTSSSYVMNAVQYPRYAKGYHNGREAIRPTLRDEPAGSLFSTAMDLSRFVSAVFAGGRGLISPKALAAMQAPQYPGLPLDFGHETGLGWMLSGLTLADGHHLVWHGGTAIPFQAFVAIEPEEKIGVVILANSEEASRFISTVAVKALELSLEIKTGRKMPPAPKPQKPMPVTLSAEELSRYQGVYATFGAQLGTVWLDKGELKMWFGDRAVELEPIGNGKFLPRKEALFGLVTSVLPHLILEYQSVAGLEAFVLRGQAMPSPFEKIEIRPIPKAWEERLGKYVTNQPGEGICYRALELVNLNSLLVARISVSSGVAGTPEAQAMFALVPVSDDEAVIGGIGTSTGAVVRAENGGLYHSGYDFKRVP